ncbi:MAG: OmpA family protein [Ferruginibacter sp.]|nr:OmpA family protein [Chitinophagaceae bacterium]
MRIEVYLIKINKLLLLLIAIVITLCTSAQSSDNYKKYPLTRLIFTDSLSTMCGYYDSLNNRLFNCKGQVILARAINIVQRIPHNLCCSLNDMDGDGINDDEDKCMYLKGPASNFGCPVINEDIVRIHYPAPRSVLFAVNSLDLSPTSIKALEDCVDLLKKLPDLKVNIEGHTDNRGSDELNRKLSMDRVKVVMDYLLLSGIDKSRITYSAYIGTYPVANPKTKAGRAMNRKVEFYLYK